MTTKKDATRNAGKAKPTADFMAQLKQFVRTRGEEFLRDGNITSVGIGYKRTGGIWGRLEDALFNEVRVADLKVSVFGGPVFRTADRVFRGVKIPREFFKVLAFVEAGRLKAKAFLLTQNFNQLEALDLNEFRVFQVTLAEVEARCAFTFPDNLKAGDEFPEQLERRPEAAAADRQPLASLADINW